MAVVDSYTYEGRVKKPLSKKLNPIWWLHNDDEQTVDEASWYHPEWPRWRRWLYWNVFRNPLQNLRCFVLGVQDRNYRVIGRTPVLAVQRNDLWNPETKTNDRGWQWSLILLPLPRPFVSWCGRHAVFYIGWQPSGIFGLKIVW